jgi:hypothetical protein
MIAQALFLRAVGTAMQGIKRGSSQKQSQKKGQIERSPAMLLIAY